MEIDKIKLFSPLQVVFITLLSGPVGAVYALATNSSELDDAAEASVIAILGGVVALVYLLLCPFVRLEISLVAAPVLASIPAYWLAKRGQAPERTRKILDHFERQTIARVLATISGALIVSLTFALVWLNLWSEIVS